MAVNVKVIYIYIYILSTTTIEATMEIFCDKGFYVKPSSVISMTYLAHARCVRCV